MQLHWTVFLEQKEHEVLLDIYNTCAVSEGPPVRTDKAGGNESPGQPQAYVCSSCQGVLEGPGPTWVVHFQFLTHWHQQVPLACVKLRNHKKADCMPTHTHTENKNKHDEKVKGLTDKLHLPKKSIYRIFIGYLFPCRSSEYKANPKFNSIDFNYFVCSKNLWKYLLYTYMLHWK